MAMRKDQIRTWPWNNQPSALHKWRVERTSATAGSIEHCDRCGRHFIERADTRGPVYCYPTPAWSIAHPEDDGALGIGADGARLGEYGRKLT